MLPSMPMLMTPIKVVNEDSSDTSNDSPVRNNSNEQENSHEQHASTDQDHNMAVDESDDLLGFEINTREPCRMTSDPPFEKMYTSELIIKSHSPDKRSLCEPSIVQKKKKKNHHKKMLAALTPDSGASLDTSAQNFAEAYFQKVRSRLNNENWNLFLQELVDFEEQEEKDPAKLYSKIEALLGSTCPDLSEQFLAFLMPEQALATGKIMSYLDTQRMMDFCRKLNILLMKRQLRQVLETLEVLTRRGPAITLQEVKDAILPLLKSSPLLADRFLELLPPERPPDSLMTDFETVDMKDDSLFETITVPDLPDPYGHDNCVCTCHTALQKNRHCVSCGIKYVNGRVYLQHGKALRPARVTFKGAKHMDLQKLEEEKCRHRRRILPMALISPGLSADQRHNPDSEDDCGVKKSPKTPKTPKIRASKSKVNKKGGGDAKYEVLDGICPLTKFKNADIGDDLKENIVEDCEDRHDENDEHDFDEIVMEECNTEEEEEDMMNKVVHSDDSSMEAEDLSKELESGNDCSFEDEEFEDFEDLDIVRDDSPKHTEDELKDMFENHNHVSDGIPENSSLDRELLLSALHESDSETKVENHISIKEEPVSAKPAEESASSLLQAGAEIEMKVECPIKQESNPEVSNVLKCSASTSESDKKIMFDVEEMKTISSSSYLNFVRDTPVSSQAGKTNEEQSVETKDNSGCREWTREEDKIILQTFQHENGLEQTFETASLQLPNRSKEEIQQRFEVLLKLLKEMISDENSNS